VLFWTGRTISLAGSAITLVVLPILVYRLSGSPFLTGLLAALEAIPYLLFGLIAGAVADRVDRRRLMVGSDLLNAGLLASIPVAAALGVLSLAQIFVVATLSASLFVWFDAANFGALPSLVGRQRLVAANSYVWSMSTLLAIVGPGIGGALAATIGPAPAISLDALSYALSAALLARIPRAFASGPPPPDRGGSPVRRTLVDIREGLDYLWHQPLVRALTLLGVGVSLTGGGVSGLLIVYAVRGLELPTTDARIGVLFTAGAIGGLAATLLLPWLIRRIPVGRITLFGLLLNPLLLLGVALAPAFAPALLLYALWAGCQSLIIINGITLRQLVVPDHLQSRVNATARLIAWGGTPFGAALGGALAEAWPIRVTLIVLAAFVATSALVGWFSPLRTAATPDAPWSNPDAVGEIS